MVCGAGDCAPTPTVNGGRLAGDSTSSALEETYNVTGMVSGLTAAAPVAGLVALMVMVPLQVPADRPAGAISTARLSGVVPLMEVLVPFNNSHAAPQVVVARDRS